MTFDIRKHLDRLKPDGGSASRDELSFHCPVCGNKNFKVNTKTGEYGSYGCDCATTESGKRRIRNAVSPARCHFKSVPPSGTRFWDYCSSDGTPLIRVHRQDDGMGRKKISQESLRKGSSAAELRSEVTLLGLSEAQQALKDGAPYVFWVEGEQCFDVVRSLDLPAVTSIGGSSGIKPEHHSNLFPAERLVVVPDQDRVGLKYSNAIADAYPGCQWLYPFPRSTLWEPANCPDNGGVDIADWVYGGATAEVLLGAIGKKKTEVKPIINIEDLNYSEILKQLLGYIEAEDKNKEMDARAILKRKFAISDTLVDSALLQEFSNRKTKRIEAKHESIDWKSVEKLHYTLDGFIIKGDVSLVYGPAGTGKTVMMCAVAHALAKGRNLLDRSAQCIPQKSLFICTDSGPEALKKSFDDLGIDTETDPLLKAGDPQQMIFTWGYAPEQGHDSWVCNINGIVKLERFIREQKLGLVIIDSAKSVSSGAGWSYTDNQQVKAIIKYLREGVANSTGCSICFISHDGSQSGSHSGAKAWAEEPSMVISLMAVKDENGSVTGVKAQFLKDRAAVVEPQRSFTYTLKVGEGFQLASGEQVVGNCAEAIIEILWEAYRNGRVTLSTQGLKDEARARHNYSAKTVENTLGQHAGNGKGANPKPILKVRRGVYALTPKELESREASLRGWGELGGGNRKSTAAQSIYQPPYQTPSHNFGGNATNMQTPKGNAVGGTQTRSATAGLPLTPPDARAAPHPVKSHTIIGDDLGNGRTQLRLPYG